jgi:hypothetical protein
VAALHHDIMELAGPSLAEGSSTNFIYTIENSKKENSIGTSRSLIDTMLLS